MKSKNEMHADEVQKLLEEYESLEKVMNQYYFGNTKNADKESPVMELTNLEEAKNKQVQ